MFLLGGCAREEAPAPPAPFRLGEAIERQIPVDGKDEIPLPLEPGWYARLSLEAANLDISVSLLDPAGRTVDSVELVSGADQKVLSLVSAASGIHKLTVVSGKPGTTADRYRFAVEEWRRARPEDPDRVAAQRGLNEGEHWVEKGNKAKALEVVRRSLKLLETIRDAQGKVEALLLLGSIHYDSEEIPQANECWEEALSIAKASGHLPGQARALRNLGVVLLGKDFDAALERFREASRLWQEHGDARKQADLQYLIGNIERNRGNSEEALAYFEQARLLAQSAGATSLMAYIQGAMGAVRASQGEGKLAMEHYEEALRLAGIAKEPGAEAVARTGFGQLQRRRGELNKAREQLSKALEIAKDSGNVGDEARVLGHLGGLYLDLGDPDQALKYYKQALDGYRRSESDTEVTRTLYYIGQVHLAKGEREEALRYFNQAWELSRKGGKPSTTGAALHGVGITRLALGQTEQAIQALEEARSLRQKGGDRLGESATLLELGRAYQKKGDLVQAASQMNNAHQVAVEAEASFVQAASLLALAKLDRDRGSLDKAQEQIEKAIKILESIRSDLPGDRLKSSFFASKRSYYEFYVDLLMRLHGRYPGQGYAERAFAASERGRARSLLELLAEGRYQVTHGIDHRLKQEESEIAARLSQIQVDLMDELSREAPKEAKIASLQEQRTQAEEELQALELKIRNKHPRYYEVRYPTALNPREIQRRLDRNMALLEYSLGEEGSYLFLLTREGLKVHPLPPAKEIEDHVLRVRNEVEKPRRLKRYLVSAHWLYEHLVAPVRRELEDKPILLIAPDGPLHLLSFDVLLTGQARNPRDPSTYPYLIRDFALVHVPSASVLPLLSKPGSHRAMARRAKRFVAFADPEYGPEEPVKIASVGPGPARGGSERASLSGLRRLPRLKGSGEEVRRISKLYEKNEWKIYEKRDATERNVKNNPLVENADRLHFAVHGVVNEQRPSLSGLVLTRAGDDDGLLQVFEIFNLNLRADLVVLSACETARGKEVKGEGLVGVTRAFLYAGAPSVVVSLWQVQDDTAPDLIVAFYQGLDRDRLGKARALQQAKLAMIARGDERSHPYHWAPFILVGKPE